MKRSLLKLGVTLSILGAFCLATPAQSGEVRSVKEIKTLYHAKSSGNDFFNRRLREKIGKTGIKFTKSRQRADAILESNGDWSNGGFAGEMTIKSRAGKVIWRESSRRGANSNKMAFEQLGEKFSRARR